MIIKFESNYIFFLWHDNKRIYKEFQKGKFQRATGQTCKTGENVQKDFKSGKNLYKKWGKELEEVIFHRDLPKKLCIIGKLRKRKNHHNFSLTRIKWYKAFQRRSWLAITKFELSTLGIRLNTD